MIQVCFNTKALSRITAGVQFSYETSSVNPTQRNKAKSTFRRGSRCVTDRSILLFEINR